LFPETSKQHTALEIKFQTTNSAQLLHCMIYTHSRGPRGHAPLKFLSFLVTLCFERPCAKQNTVFRRKKNWVGYATVYTS